MTDDNLDMRDGISYIRKISLASIGVVIILLGIFVALDQIFDTDYVTFDADLIIDVPDMTPDRVIEKTYFSSDNYKMFKIHKSNLADIEISEFTLPSPLNIDSAVLSQSLHLNSPTFDEGTIETFEFFDDGTGFYIEDKTFLCEEWDIATCVNETLFGSDEVRRANFCGEMFGDWGLTVEWANGESVDPLTPIQLLGFHEFFTHQNCYESNMAVLDDMRELNPKLMKEYETWLEEVNANMEINR